MSSAKSRWRASLGVRVTAWYFVVFLVSTLLLVSIAGFRIRSSIHEKIVETVTSSVKEHEQAFAAGGIDGLKQLTEAPENQHRALYVRLLGRDDATLFEHRSTPELSFDTTKHANDGMQRVHADADGSTWSLSTTTMADGSRLQLALSDDQAREVVGHLRAGLLVVWIGAIALGLMGGFFVTYRALRPIQSLATTARNVIDSGDLTLRVPERGTNDELEELSRLFNGVLARNQALVRGMREALDNVAHDLRTPLTRLRTGAEVALQQSGDEARVREALADAIEESERVQSMLTTLMDISEAETGVMKLTRSRVDLNEVVRAAIDLYQLVADERGVRVLTHLANDVYANGDSSRLHQVVANLLDNAIKYTPTGGLVELTTLRVEPWACLTIKDSGTGISAVDLPRIFDRLYRADQSRSERGLGLGLSFVKAIVEAHDGQVEVQSELGIGSTFVVRLPTG